MPEQKMSYEERKQITAKAFASLTIDNKLSTGKSIRIDMTSAGHDKRIKAELRHAKKAIAMQAEAIREALKLFRAPVWTEQYLLEHGYIEPKTEEDDSTRTH